jgi:hypothetical protein
VRNECTPYAGNLHRQKQHTAAKAMRHRSLDLEQPAAAGLMNPCARTQTCAQGRFFLGLVVIADAKLPIPSRTRPISAPTPMVLRLKTWESRSPPNLERNDISLKHDATTGSAVACRTPVRGCTSPVRPQKAQAFEHGQNEKCQAARRRHKPSRTDKTKNARSPAEGTSLQGRIKRKMPGRPDKACQKLSRGGAAR